VQTVENLRSLLQPLKSGDPLCCKSSDAASSNTCRSSSIESDHSWRDITIGHTSVKEHWRSLSLSLPLNRFQRTHPHATRSAPFTNWWSIYPTTSEENEVGWTTSLPLSSPLENRAEGITDVAYLMSWLSPTGDGLDVHGN
jgi:transglutaminase/protease-like cytokinesis protein 3